MSNVRETLEQCANDVIGIAVIALALAVFAMRMSYEKYCIRTRKPFKSWLRERRADTER